MWKRSNTILKAPNRKEGHGGWGNGDKGDQTRSKKIFETNLLEQKLFCRKTPHSKLLSLCLEEFFSWYTFFFFFGKEGWVFSASLPISFSPFHSGSLARPPTPSGFQEHPEDIY